MSATLSDNQAVAHGMLDAFRRDLKVRLVEHGIAAVRPAIEQAAEQAIAELQMKVESEYDMRRNRTVLALILQTAPTKYVERTAEVSVKRIGPGEYL